MSKIQTSKGEDLVVSQLDRSYGGSEKEILKVDGESGDLSIKDAAGNEVLNVDVSEGSLSGVIASSENDGLMSASQADAISSAISSASIDIYIGDWSAQGGSPGLASDSNDGLSKNFPVATMAKARSLRSILASGTGTVYSRINFALGSFSMPALINLTGGVDGIASWETWIGTDVNQLGTLVSTAGTTGKHVIASALASLRSGATASISAASGSGQTRTMTVMGMSSLTAADVGKNFFFPIAVNKGNIGTFKMASFISATSATFFNAQAVVENTGLIAWQDSFRGATLTFSGGTAAAQGARRIVGYGGVATGTINVVAVANLVDNDNFTVPNGNGIGSTSFEYKVTGGFVPVGGRVTIDVSALTTAAEVAVATVAAINGVAPSTLAVRATNSAGSAVVKVKAMIPGASDNISANNTITEAVANAGFTVSGFTGGAGNSLTTFTILGAAGFSPAPTVGDSFVVEKPGSILSYGAGSQINGSVQRLGIKSIKLQGSSSSASMITTGLFTIWEKSEFDLAGGSFNPTSYSVYQGAGGSWGGDGASNPFATVNSVVYFHNGAFSSNEMFSGAAGSPLMFDHAAVTFGTITRTSAVFLDAERTTFNQNGRGTMTALRMDNALLSTDSPIQLGEAAVFRITSASTIDNSPNYGINCLGASLLELGPVAGDGNVKAGIHVDQGSRLLIDIGTATILTGTPGDTEFSHYTVPNIVSYTTIRTADANGVKGYPGQGDAAAAYGNRADVS